MNGLTIIVPYWKREDNLKRLLAVYEHLDKTIFKIKVVQVAPTEKGFNTGKAQNIAIEEADTDWVFKNDVDCIGTPEMYEILYEKTKTMKENEYHIIGVQYLGADNITPIPGKLICGNEYLIHKNAWKAVGKCPEWEGHGWEDYCFEYLLEKNYNPKFRLSSYSLDTISDKIRDELVIRKNKEVPFYFWHYQHPIEHKREVLQENKKKLFEYITKKENIIC